MFFATHNDRGPHMLLLQALLRMSGYKLKINGIWDAATEASVQAFRTKMGASTAYGPVNGAVTAQLLWQAHIKIIDAVDASLLPEHRTMVEQEMTRNQHVKPIFNERRPGHGVEDAISRIKKRSHGHHIGALRFSGHGNLGRWICIAVGDPVHALDAGRRIDYERMAADWPSYIDYSHFERIRPLLRPLRRCFAPFAFVQIHSCRIGQQTGLLQKLADTWNVPVTGGLSVQPIAEYTTNAYGDRVASALVITGPATIAYPGGSDLASWANRVDQQVLDIPGMIDAGKCYVAKQVKSVVGR